MSKKLTRNLITVGLGVALIVVIVVSSQHDASNPHATIPKDTWLYEKHALAVKNASNLKKNCYECHIEKGLGGEEYCQSCHTQSGITVELP